MTSRRRITIALIGLLLLVLVGWFVRESAQPQSRPQPRCPRLHMTVQPTMVRDVSILAACSERVADDYPSWGVDSFFPEVNV